MFIQTHLFQHIRWDRVVIQNYGLLCIDLFKLWLLEHQVRIILDSSIFFWFLIDKCELWWIWGRHRILLQAIQPINIPYLIFHRSQWIDGTTILLLLILTAIYDIFLNTITILLL